MSKLIMRPCITYQTIFPGLKPEFLASFETSLKILPVRRLVKEHQEKFESKTVVYTNERFFCICLARGYKTDLATFLTEDADEDIISHWTLAQWNVAFLSYATSLWSYRRIELQNPTNSLTWASVAGDTQEGGGLKSVSIALSAPSLLVSGCVK